MFLQTKYKMTYECACIITALIDDPGSTLTTTLECVFTIIICVCGVMVNYRFMRKLEEEKRNTPLGRKGNVIEPIMRWFLRFQIIYWPYHMTCFWILYNHIIPSEYMAGWWCNVVLNGIQIGRMSIAYNSTFVAFIRYLYIVHYKKVDKWDYEKVRKGFAISSIAIPVLIEMVGAVSSQYETFTRLEKYNDCILDYLGLNSTHILSPHKPILVRWFNVSVPLVRWIYHAYTLIFIMVFLNVIDCLLYFAIHRSIKRYVLFYGYILNIVSKILIYIQLLMNYNALLDTFLFLGQILRAVRRVFYQKQITKIMKRGA